MELMHECEGELKVLLLHGLKTARRTSLADYEKNSNPMVTHPVPYYENYVCPDCNIHVMRAMPQEKT